MLRRIASLSFIFGYLLANGWFLYRSAVGDTYSSPIAAMMTWDMFPNYQTKSQRSFAVGKTRQGRHIDLLNELDQRFHWGQDQSLLRTDIDRSGALLKSAVQRELARDRLQNADDPVEHVYLIEEYWPARFNLPDQLYRREYDGDKPDRRYWRVVAEFDAPSTE